VNTRIVSLSFLIFVTVAIAQESVGDSSRTVLSAAKSYYTIGDYTKAIKELKKIEKQSKGGEKIEVYEYLALCYTAVGDRETALDYFKKLLHIEPKYELNPITTSPEILELFENAKKERASESAMCSCFIPGFGQFMEGNEEKGKIIMAAAGLFLSTSIISWLITDNKGNYYNSLGPDDIDEIKDAYQDYDRWYKISLVNSSIFLSIYIYSIIDALSLKKEKKTIPQDKNTGLFIETTVNSFQVGYRMEF